MVDRAQRLQQGSPVVRQIDRPGRSFRPADRVVGIEQDHEHVAESGRPGEGVQMPGVQDVETAVGGDDGQFLPAPLVSGSQKPSGMMDARSAAVGVSGPLP